MGQTCHLLLVYLLCLSAILIDVGGVHSYDSDFPMPLESLSLQRSIDGSMGDGRAVRRRLSDERSLSSYDRFPLYHMLGSYFAYIWVGTPPQRVSVIIDTGSHFTAFPCVGCNCGKHIDPYFNPKASSTSEVMNCFAGNKCYIKQSYSEGSSWHAYKVKDRVWVGDKGVKALQQSDGGASTSRFTATNDMVALSSNLSTLFTFGCQDREAGLFRTQQIDGIMGLTAEPDTLPFVLERNGVTTTRAFSLCFTHGRGVLSLGGVDPTLHLPPPRGTIKYARLLQSSGWYTVRLLDILMRNPSTGEVESIGVSGNKYNGGRGVIIDSGTTDTYLPSDIAEKWNNLFAKTSSGMKYSTRQREMDDSDLEYLPTIIYRFEGLPGSQPIEIESPPSSYTEAIELKSGRTKRAFRIYTTERKGTVLGANFMVGHNVIFDVERQRIGFAGSDCEHVDRTLGASYNLARERRGNLEEIPSLNASDERYPYPHIDDGDLYTKMRNALSTSCGVSSTFLKSPCSATCPGVGIDVDNAVPDGSVSHLAEGVQEWAQRDCGGDAQSSPTYSYYREKCGIFCDKYNGKATHGTSTRCKAEEWSSCSPNCEQQRYIPAAMITADFGDDQPGVLASFKGYFAKLVSWLNRDEGMAWRTCKLKLQRRSCHVHKCPVRKGDSAVTMLLRIAHVSNLAWSLIHREDLISAMSKALLLPQGIIHGENLNLNTTSENITLHMRIRIPDSLFLDTSRSVCRRIAEIVGDDKFPDLLAHEINGDSTSSGNWRWITGSSTIAISHIVVKNLNVVKDSAILRPQDANSNTPSQSNEANKGRVQAISEARVRNYKKNANLFNIDYAAYGSPRTWDRVTWMKILVIACIQGGALATFFILRRIRTIQEQSREDPPLAFDAYKGLPAQKHNKKVGSSRKRMDRSKGALDRRASRGVKSSTV